MKGQGFLLVPEGIKAAKREILYEEKEWFGESVDHVFSDYHYPVITYFNLWVDRVMAECSVAYNFVLFDYDVIRGVSSISKLLSSSQSFF